MITQKQYITPYLLHFRPFLEAPLGSLLSTAAPLPGSSTPRFSSSFCLLFLGHRTVLSLSPFAATPFSSSLTSTNHCFHPGLPQPLLLTLTPINPCPHISLPLRPPPNPSLNPCRYCGRGLARSLRLPGLLMGSERSVTSLQEPRLTQRVSIGSPGLSQARAAALWAAGNLSSALRYEGDIYEK